MTIKELQDKAFGNALLHGFHHKGQNLGEQLMLIVSEISEALEADRRDRWASLDKYLAGSRTRDDFTRYLKDTVEDELADAVIRIADLAGYLEINLEEHIKAKMKYNQGRPHKHGKLY
jgi:NTP pyrophosphatase (non-canonical NTP hydrolase)